VPTFEKTVLSNGDWFVDIELFDEVLKFAAENEYNVTFPSFADEDSDLYGILVRHTLKDVYVVPSVIALPSATA
jgi:hypothetical protein